MATEDDFWAGRRVLVTGHTGFKGTWLTLWLARLGAEVVGLSRSPPPVLGAAAESLVADLRSPGAVEEAVREADPEVVLHLGAQAVVGRSTRDPVGTYGVNVLGTVNLLDAIRVAAPRARAVVCVTTDRVYEPHGGAAAYPETAALGGRHPYGSSNACQELVVSAFRSSFLAAQGVGAATARAGNVLGGGDWAEDRLVPDLMRAALGGAPVHVRSPGAVLPWQHVLDTLDGYLRLARRLWEAPEAFAGAWNFGPPDADARPVRWIVERVRERWPGEIAVRLAADGDAGTAPTLRLDSAKARERLGWLPRWDLGEALDATVEWYAGHRDGADVRELCEVQIARYTDRASLAGACGSGAPPGWAPAPSL